MVKKIVFIAVCVIVLFFSGMVTGCTINKRGNNQSITELEDTINNLTERNRLLLDTNKELGINNNKLSEGIGKLEEDNRELSDINLQLETNLREANGIISNLTEGITETKGRISDSIGTIDQIIESIKNSPDLE